MVKEWFLYVLECGDGTLYTGITTDLERRFRQHQAGQASKYTRTRLPVKLVHWERAGTRSEALRRERDWKKLRRKQKWQWIVERGSLHEHPEEF
jgi:putative endonuclease